MRVGIGFRAGGLFPDASATIGEDPASGFSGVDRTGAADVVILAIRDALMGATGLALEGPSEAAPQDASGSRALERLEWSVRRVEEENYQVVNVDVSLGTARQCSGATQPGEGILMEMRRLLAGVLHTSPAAVSLKTTESIGSVGERADLAASSGAAGENRREAEGRFAMAVVLIDQIRDIDALHASMRAGA
ncbi:MAG: 2-C-methyl-D-erythritol 2,4-cyclodiphosphate synthase [Gemmatimonadota bacterium]